MANFANSMPDRRGWTVESENGRSKFANSPPIGNFSEQKCSNFPKGAHFVKLLALATIVWAGFISIQEANAARFHWTNNQSPYYSPIGATGTEGNYPTSWARINADETGFSSAMHPYIYLNDEPPRHRPKWSSVNHLPKPFYGNEWLYDDIYGKLYWSSVYTNNHDQQCGNGWPCFVLAFYPDAAAINALKPGDTVRIVFQLRFWNTQSGITSTPNNPTQTLEIDLYIHKEGSRVSWNTNELDDNDMPIVTADPTTTEYPNIVGTVNVNRPEYSWYRGGSSETLNGRFRISGNNREIYTHEVSSLPSGFYSGNTSRIRVYGSGWSNGSGKMRAGYWFFDQESGNVLFRPRSDYITAMNPGDILVNSISLEVRTSSRVFAYSFSVSIRKPGIFMAWDNPDDATLAKNNSGTYPSINGTVVQQYLTSLQETHWDSTPNLSAVVVQGSDSTTFTATLTAGVSGFGIALPAKFGTFLWGETSDNFRFNPDPMEIGKLEDDDVATITLSGKVEISEVVHVQTSIELTIVGLSKPELSISTDTLVVNEGESFTFTLESNKPPPEALTVEFETTGSVGSYVTSVPVATLGTDGMPQTVTVTSTASSSADGDGLAVISIKDLSGYTSAVNMDSITVEILDEQTSRPAIGFADSASFTPTASPGEPINEGVTQISAEITSDKNVSAQGIPIRYKVTQTTGDYALEPDVEKVIEMTGSTSTATILVNLRAGDSTFTPDGVIRVEILADDNVPARYTLATDFFKTPTIIESSPAPLYVTATSLSITEGASVNIQFKVDKGYQSPRQIKYRISGAENFLRDTYPAESIITFPANETSLPLPAIATIQDEDIEFNQVLTVQLIDEGAYVVDVERTQVQIDVYDDDRSEGISILPAEEKFAANNTINEGDVAMLQISRDPATPFDGTETILLEVTGDSNYIGDYEQSVTPPADTSYFQYEFNSAQDELNRPDGTVTISVVPNPTSAYEISALHGSIAITVKDDDIPVISIDAGATPSPVSEDDQAVFRLVAVPAPRSNLTINLLIGEADPSNPVVDGLQSPIQTVVMGSSGIADLTVSLFDDETVGDSGGVKVIIRPPDRSGEYRLGSITELTVHVQDDDAVFTGPMVSMSTPNTLVTAGSSFAINFNANPAPSEPLEVTVNMTTDSGSEILDESNNQIQGLTVNDSGQGIVTIGENGRGTMEIETSDQSDISLIVAELAAGQPAQYRSFPGRGRVAVTLIPDVPRVSISRYSKEIVQGGLATYRIAIDHSLSYNINVKLKVTQSADLIFDRAPRIVPFRLLATYSEFHLQTDSNAAEAGSITVELVEGEDYALHETEPTTVTTEVVAPAQAPSGSQQSVSVANMVLASILGAASSSQPEESENVPAVIPGNTVERASGNPPEISVAAVNPVVEEGAVVQFKFTASRPISNDLDLAITIFHTGGYIEAVTPKFVKLNAGRRTAMLGLATSNDEIASADGEVELRIENGSDYVPHQSDFSATVTVSDQADRARRMAGVEHAVHSVQTEFLSSLGRSTQNVLSARLDQASGRSGQNTFNLGGMDEFQDFLIAGGEAMNGNPVAWQDLLGNSSFSIDLSLDDGTPGRAVVWGLGDNGDLVGRNSGASWSGGYFTGQFGLETRTMNGVRIGLATAFTESDIGYQSNRDEEYAFNHNSTGFNPYISYLSPDGGYNVSAHAGIGTGKTILHQENYTAANFDSNFAIFGLAADSRLLASEGLIPGGLTEVRVTGEGWSAQQQTFGPSELPVKLLTEIAHGIVSLDGSHRRNILDLVAFSTEASAGISVDRENGVVANSMVLDSQSTLNLPYDVAVAGTGAVVFSELGHIQNWTVALPVNFDHKNDGLGLMVEFHPSWGWTDTLVAEQSWSGTAAHYNRHDKSGLNGTRIRSELGYGIDLQNNLGRIIPSGAVEMENGRVDELQLGSRLNLGHYLNLDVTGTNEFSNSDTVARELKMNGTIQW